MVSSGVFAGKFPLEEVLAIADPEGLTMGGELARIGYAGEAPVGGRPFHAYVEAHIEQGPILEEEEKAIGVATGAQGKRWYAVTLTGQASPAVSMTNDRPRAALLGQRRSVQAGNRATRQ